MCEARATPYTSIFTGENINISGSKGGMGFFHPVTIVPRQEKNPVGRDIVTFF
jgi:hypothetical protein